VGWGEAGASDSGTMGLERALVAIDLPGGPAFCDAVRWAWDAGAAVLPLHPGLPEAWKHDLLVSLAPSFVMEAPGRLWSLAGGRPVEEGDALVIPTSGSSGTPKGVVLTHAALDAAADASNARLGTDAGVTWLACLPLHHIGGFSVLTRAWRTGAGLVVHDRFDAAAVEAAADAGATHTSLVPTALGRIDAARFERILLGGSAIPADRPANTVATYGMTESGAGVVYDGIPLDGVVVRIDPADGVIELRSPTLLRCYRDDHDPKDAGGWYRTGDVGRFDPDDGDRLVVEGRADDLIITGAEKVWPAVVEDRLRTHPGVADVAVLGEPDPEWGQRVTAIVVPADPAAPPALDELRDHVRAVLPVAAAPKELRLVERLPRTALGKLRRSELGRS